MLYLFIFVMSAIEFGTYAAKMLLLPRGSKFRTSLLAMAEPLAWAIGGGGFLVTVLFDNLFTIIPYICGLSFGFVSVIYLMKKYSDNKTTVIVMGKEKSMDKIASELEIEEYGITELVGEYKNKVFLIATRGHRVNKLRKIIKKVDKKVTIVTNSKVSIQGGFLH